MKKEKRKRKRKEKRKNNNVVYEVGWSCYLERGKLS